MVIKTDRKKSGVLRLLEDKAESAFSLARG